MSKHEDPRWVLFTELVTNAKHYQSELGSLEGLDKEDVDTVIGLINQMGVVRGTIELIALEFVTSDDPERVKTMTPGLLMSLLKNAGRLKSL